MRESKSSAATSETGGLRGAALADGLAESLDLVVQVVDFVVALPQHPVAARARAPTQAAMRARRAGPRPALSFPPKWRAGCSKRAEEGGQRSAVSSRRPAVGGQR